MKKHWVRTTINDREYVGVPDAVSELAQDMPLRYAELYGTGLADLTLTTASTWYPCVGLVLGEFLTGLSCLTSSLRSYIRATIDGMFLLNVHCSLVASVNLPIVHMGVFLNGALVPKLQTSVGVDLDDKCINVTGLVALRVGDEVELKFSGSIDASAISITHINLNIVQCGS